MQGEAGDWDCHPSFLRVNSSFLIRRLLLFVFYIFVRGLHRIYLALLFPPSRRQHLSIYQLGFGIDELLLCVSKYFEAVFAKPCPE